MMTRRHVRKPGTADPRARGRGWIALAVAVAVLVGIPTAITVINDASARQVETRLRALPLPEGAELLDSLSQAGKLTGNGNGMQYLGVLLLQSDRPAEELQHFYDAQAAGVDLSVTVTAGGALRDLHRAPGFLGEQRQPATVLVYAWGDGPGELFEQFDLRGH